jgi:uncharacterized membrane protein
MDQQNQAVEETTAVRSRMGLWIHVAAYLVVNAFLVGVNLLTSPNYLWFPWVLAGWGLGILLHLGLMIFLPKRTEGRQQRLASELRRKGHRRSHAK